MECGNSGGGEELNYSPDRSANERSSRNSGKDANSGKFSSLSKPRKPKSVFFISFYHGSLQLKLFRKTILNQIFLLEDFCPKTVKLELFSTIIDRRRGGFGMGHPRDPGPGDFRKNPDPGDFWKNPENPEDFHIPGIGIFFSWDGKSRQKATSDLRAFRKNSVF